MNARKRFGRRAACLCLLIITAPLLPGCVVGRQNPAATQPATAVSPETSLPAYWLDKPAVTKVTAGSFDALWNACLAAAYADGFEIDRRDYREGLLTTLPLVSKQVFEVWRNDVVDPDELSQSTLGTLRRTVRFTLRRLPDGRFEAEPRVLVERFSTVERHITSVSQYHDIFAVRIVDLDKEIERTGVAIPLEYWYSIGRDYPLERRIAQDVQAKLHQIR